MSNNVKTAMNQHVTVNSNKSKLTLLLFPEEYCIKLWKCPGAKSRLTAATAADPLTVVGPILLVVDFGGLTHKGIAGSANC